MIRPLQVCVLFSVMVLWCPTITMLTPSFCSVFLAYPSPSSRTPRTTGGCDGTNGQAAVQPVSVRPHRHLPSQTTTHLPTTHILTLAFLPPPTDAQQGRGP